MAHPLWSRALREGVPLIRGRIATLLWRGRVPPALFGDFNGWDMTKPKRGRHVAPGIWSYSLSLPRDAYMEYAFLRLGPRDPSPDERRDRRLDPLNPRTTPNGLGATNNFFYMPEASPTSLTRRLPGTPQGKVSRHEVPCAPFVAGTKRTVYLYQPPVRGPCPLVVTFDGPEYLRRARLPTIVDNLIAQGRIRPIAVAMLAHDWPTRYLEYACNDSTLRFLLATILPLAQDHLRLIPPERSAGRYGMLGASMGGLMSLYVSLRMPELFGRVISQSGALDTFGREHVVFDLARRLNPGRLKAWLDVGSCDIPELLPSNRRMRRLLKSRGQSVAFREFHGGHNWPSWRNNLGDALCALYPT